MVSRHSTQPDWSGQVNDDPKEWRFEKADQPEQIVLNRANDEHHVEQPTAIKNQDIIAIVPSAVEHADEYDVLFVEETAKGSDPQASSVLFKSITVTQPPEWFLEDFAPSKKSYLNNILHSQSPNTKVSVIVSIGSGTRQARDFFEKALRPLLHHLQPSLVDTYELHSTTSEHTVTELTQEIFLPLANQGLEQAIILLSGDGGMVDILNALLSGAHTTQYQKPNIALLPMGTGNALANSTGILGDKTMGLRTLLRGTPRDLPLFRVSFSPDARFLVNEGRGEKPLGIVDRMPTVYGAVVCSWGLHAALVADSDTAEYRKFGAERFKMAAKEALFPSDGTLPHAYKGTLSILKSGPEGEAEWKRIPRDQHGYVLSTLVSHLESGFQISPASSPLDGKLRLVHFGPLSGQEAMSVMGKAYQGGQHVKDERLGYDEVRGIRIYFDEEEPRWRRVCVDGKIVLVEKGGWLEIRIDDVGPVVALVTTRQE